MRMYRTMRKPRDPSAAYELTKKKFDKAVKRHDSLVGVHSEYAMTNPRKAKVTLDEMYSLYDKIAEYTDDLIYLNEKYGVGDDDWCERNRQ